MGPKVMRMESKQDSVIRKFIVCIVHLIKSGRSRWAGHASIMEEGGNAFNILTGILTGKRFL